MLRGKAIPKSRAVAPVAAACRGRLQQGQPSMLELEYSMKKATATPTNAPAVTRYGAVVNVQAAFVKVRAEPTVATTGGVK